MKKHEAMSGRRSSLTTTEGSLSVCLHHVSVISILILWHVTASQLIEPHERMDVMGTYRLTNSEQCQRLCWYRRLCISYSFTANTDLDKNCVLHLSQDENVIDQPGINSTSSGWRESSVQQHNASSSSTSCAGSRPCGQAEVCVPEFSGSFRCLSFPAQCGTPEVIANAVEMTGQGMAGVQGATATVQCLPDFVQVPINVSMEIQCQVTSRWSPFPGECVQAVYRGAAANALHNNTRLPWTAPAGELRACISGVYNTAEREYINVYGGPDSSDDLILHIDFRHQFRDGSYKEIVLGSRTNGNWGPERRITSPAMPLEEGDTFSMSVHATKDLLQLTMLRNDAQNVTLEASISSMGIQLEGGSYIGAGPLFSLNHADLVDTCG